MSGDDESEAKNPVSTYLPAQLHERARAAVWWTRVIPGEPDSLSELVSRGLANEVERIEREHNEGEPFVIPEGEKLRPGPPPGVMERVARRRRQSSDRDSGAAG